MSSSRTSVVWRSAFTAAARKDFGPMTDTPPPTMRALDEDWRTAYPPGWRSWRVPGGDPAAWEGMSPRRRRRLSRGGGGFLALAEVVVHGWDLARATGVPYGADEATTKRCWSTLRSSTRRARRACSAGGAHADDAPVFDRIVAMSGRDPGWGSGVG